MEEPERDDEPQPDELDAIAEELDGGDLEGLELQPADMDDV